MLPYKAITVQSASILLLAAGNLILRAMTKSPKERITPMEAYNHSFFKTQAPHISPVSPHHHINYYHIWTVS